jgi:hypothetical protein
LERSTPNLPLGVPGKRAGGPDKSYIDRSFHLTVRSHATIKYFRLLKRKAESIIPFLINYLMKPSIGKGLYGIYPNM